MFLAAQHELLLQIIERPDDDELRLVLADQLSEASDPLGELIVVQCALEQQVKGNAVANWAALEAREAELLRDHEERWRRQFAPFAQRLEMKRGLPHTLVCEASDLLDDGGLTVLAPIQELELVDAHGDHLDALFRLPLLWRVKALGLGDVSGLSGLDGPPAPMPANLTRLTLRADDGRALDAAIAMGLLAHVEHLELKMHWLPADEAVLLASPAVPRLVRVTFTPPPRAATHDAWDVRWHPSLRAVLAARPGLVIVWRGIEYDAQNVDAVPMPLEPDHLVWVAPVAAAKLSREPFGTLRGGALIDRALPTAVGFSRLPDGALVAGAGLDLNFNDADQPLALDAGTHLVLEPNPSVLAARAFTSNHEDVRVRYESWPCRPLSAVPLPLPPRVALAVVLSLARGLISIRTGLLRQGLTGFPSALSRDEVLVGDDGAVKLMPPFLNCALRDEGRPDHETHLRRLGLSLWHELHGTDQAVVMLLGGALMHLIAGSPVARAVRPSALDAELGWLDALVEGCLSTRCSQRFSSVAAFTRAASATGRVASQDEVARTVRPAAST